MPLDYISETACTADYELDELRVDTSRVAVVTRLLRMGFREVTKENSKPYRRFIGKVDQLRFTKTKADRRPRANNLPSHKSRKSAPEKA
jgi:hypothetical protein